MRFRVPREARASITPLPGDSISSSDIVAAAIGGTPIRLRGGAPKKAEASGGGGGGAAAIQDRGSTGFGTKSGRIKGQACRRR